MSVLVRIHTEPARIKKFILARRLLDKEGGIVWAFFFLFGRGFRLVAFHGYRSCGYATHYGKSSHGYGFF